MNRIITDGGESVTVSITAPIRRVYIKTQDWTGRVTEYSLSVDQSKQLRKALKAAEKEISS